MNYLQAINYSNNLLKKNNQNYSNLDSELMLAKVLNLSRERILINLNKKIYKDEFKKFSILLKRRMNNEPIAYILNEKNFWKYKFYVNEYVLIPRPETELIIEEFIKLVDFSKSKRLLDIGTGSGCLIISLVKERPKCYAKAIDISKKALKIAEINAKMHHIRNKISFVNINVDKFRDNKYDVIVSNPPYIKKHSLKRLDNDIKFFEPHIALEAGVDGLREIKKIIIKSKKLLKINGKLIFEIGNKQVEYSKYFLMMNGFYVNKICKDIRSIPRVIVSTKIF